MANQTIVTKVPRTGRSSQEVVAPRARTALAIVNDSDLPLYLRMGSEPATEDDWSVKVEAHQRVGPFGSSYDGAVQGLWVGQGAALARVTEVVSEQ